MTQAISDLDQLLATMSPVLQAGVHVFTTVAAGQSFDPAEVVASIREQEGLSIVVSEAHAMARGLPFSFRAAWISLAVHSDLHAVGLTAAFAKALAEVGISCNVVAGNCHDHLFVPVERAGDAMEALSALQQRAALQRPA